MQRFTNFPDSNIDRSLSEHYHPGQRPRRPLPRSNMSTGDRGHFSSYTTPTLGSPSQTGTGSRYGTAGSTPLLPTADSSSLSINYLPAKFGAGLVSRRRYGKDLSVSEVPKQGGGREAFKANEPRMPGVHDEDYDGVQGAWFGPNSKKPVLRWTRFKWIMFVANIFVCPFNSITSLHSSR